VIIDGNKRHFAHAEGPPFTQEPLSGIGTSNGYSVYQNVEGAEIRVPEDAFVETELVM
jgi:hypothetical protein